MARFSGFLAVYLQDKILRFRITLMLIIILFACGPKPEVKISAVSNNPQEVWDGFSYRYNDINTLAISGDLTITADKIYNCKLQLLYASPDSFAFMAEGTLGIDLARGAICGDSGFWEIPRERYHEKLHQGDRINFEDGKFQIDIEQLLQAVFYFQEYDDVEFIKQTGSRFIYLYNSNHSKIVMEINRDSLTPVRQTFFGSGDTTYAEYYNWKSLADNKAFPGIIKIYSFNPNTVLEYKIDKIRANRSLKTAFFLPKF